MSRIYIVGAGVIAREHAKAVSLITGGPHEIVVHDTNNATMTSFLQEFPQARPIDNADAFFAEPAREDDIVIVATPPSSHATLACRALESGRHTLCEKPLAISQKDVDLMFATAERLGRHLGCCSNRFIGFEATERAKHLFKQGDLGKAYHLTCVHKIRRGRSGIEYQPQTRWFLNRAYSGGGPSLDWGVYDITTLFDVIRPISVWIKSAWMNRAVTAEDPSPDIIYDVETHFGASLQCLLEDNSVIDVSYERSSCTHGEGRLCLEIEGTHGAFKWDYVPWFRESHPQCSLVTVEAGRAHEEVFTFDGTSGLGCHGRPLYYFHRLLQGEEPRALVGNRAKFNISVIFGIIEAAQTNRVIKVELDEGAE